MKSRPIIAIIGRPNVGKSTLFNRLIGRREAITAREAGTTRDRHFGVTEWFGHSWTIIDTAGLVIEGAEKNLGEQDLKQAMEEQVLLAVEEANLITLIVDVQEGMTPDDEKLIRALRTHNKPIVILANKADNPELRIQSEVFHRFGAAAVFPISSIHGTGIRDFIDYLIIHYPYEEPETTTMLPRVTFIGRPNVGKSTLLNRVLGKERVIVSELPGTTRDTIEVDANLPGGQHFMLIDTAGIRRRGKTGVGIEYFSLVRTLKAINESDIVTLILTIEEPPTRGDAHIAAYALEAGKKIILLMNKADLAREPIGRLSPQKQSNIGQRFLHRFPFMQRLPSYFISAQTGEGVDAFLNALTAELNKHAIDSAES